MYVALILQTGILSNFVLSVTQYSMFVLVTSYILPVSVHNPNRARRAAVAGQ